MHQIFTRRLPLAMFAVASVASLSGEAVAQNGEASRTQTMKPAFAGRWELDLARMPDTYGPPPKQVVYDFQEVGAGQWRTTIDITAPDGSVRHSVVTYRPDGTTARGQGDTIEADSAAVIAPIPNVLVMNLAKNKLPRSVRVYTLSASGNEMTESAAAVNDAGDPYIRNFHFRRLR